MGDLFSSGDLPSSEKWYWTHADDDSSKKKEENSTSGSSPVADQQHHAKVMLQDAESDQASQTDGLTQAYTDQTSFKLKENWLWAKHGAVVTLSLAEFWDEEFANALRKYYEALRNINDTHQLDWRYHKKTHHNELFERGLTLEISYGIVIRILKVFDERVLGKGRSMSRGVDGAAVHMVPALKIERYRTSLELLGQYMDGDLQSEHMRQADRILRAQ